MRLSPDDPKDSVFPDKPAPETTPQGKRLVLLSLTALGVVYGDIGTSPLYALRECFFGNPVAVTPANVLGILSLIFWSLIVIISIKYLIVVMRADNSGEGGVLALLALLEPRRAGQSGKAATLLLMGIFGAALLYGDGMITPAISVLSAVEGLKVAAPGMNHLIMPATIVILVLLFATQKRGTAWIGVFFGPIMILWFLLLALLGMLGIARNPAVLAAINPWYGMAFFIHNPPVSYLALGGVFLVVTGGEALYADMGHFGCGPIRLGWFGLVLPALLLNYMGQGAFILEHPVEAIHPFYNLVPHWGVYPMIGLATLVTVIASQAVISGTFSLARQAVQMGLSPPLNIVQTSPEEIGQIYVPVVNWALLIATVALVISFGSSDKLAAAYGLAVSATMVITTILLFFVMRDKWHWRPAVIFSVTGVFLVIDLAFFGANLFKIAEGGWFPLLVGGTVLLLMTTWRKGRILLYKRISKRTMAIAEFLHGIERNSPIRIPGTAVFTTSPGSDVPNGLLHHLKINQTLHERVLLLTAVTEDVPRIPASERLEVKALKCGFYRVFVHYGFMQSPNFPVAIKLCEDQQLIPRLDSDTTVYYAGRSTLSIAAQDTEMLVWRKRLFMFLARNSQRAVEFYRLPPGRSVELGIQVEF